MSEKAVLRPEEVQGVLAGQTPPPGDEVQPYSLREPLAIPPAARDEARARLEQVVAVLNESFRIGETIEITLDDMQQQPAAAALSVLPSPAWVASLVRPDGGGLALSLHPGVALALVDAAMGGPGTIPEDVRAATSVESRVFKMLLSTAAARLEPLLGTKLAPIDPVTGCVPRSVAASGETVAVGVLRFKIGESENASLLLITGSLLAPASREPEDGPLRQPGPLAKPLERVSLSVQPVLEAGNVNLNDVMALRIGKVLRLDAPGDAAVDLRVEGRTVARGRIVRREDRPVFAIDRLLGKLGPAEPREEKES